MTTCIHDWGREQIMKTTRIIHICYYRQFGWSFRGKWDVKAVFKFLFIALIQVTKINCPWKYLFSWTLILRWNTKKCVVCWLGIIEDPSPMSREPPETSASMDHFHFSNPKIDSLSLFSNEQRTTWDQRLSVEKFPLNGSRSLFEIQKEIHCHSVWITFTVLYAYKQKFSSTRWTSTFTLIDITSVFTFTFIAIIIIFTFPFLGITLSWEHLLPSPWKENPLPQRRLIGSQHKTSQNISQLNTKHQKFSHKEEKILHKILATSAPTAKTSFQQNSDNYLGTVFIQVKQKFLRHMNMF